MSTRSTLRYTLGALALVAAAAAFPAASHAVVFNLDSDHCSGGCGPAGTIFGSVALTQNGTTVDVVVDLFNSFQFAKTGSVDLQAFKFNATGVVVDDISVNQNSSEPPVYPIRLPPLGVKPMFKNRLSFVESWIHQPA